MSKYTTKQLKDAILAMKDMKGEDVARAHRMACDELERRIGGDSFDAWCDSVGL